MQNPNACPWGENGSLTWPARCYSCTFCSREFRSAQALGGHMNVHRRDRARLRQCCPSNLTTTIIFPDSKLSFLSSDDSIPLLGEPILGKPVTVSALGGIYLPNDNANCSLCIDKGTNGSVVEMLDLELRLWW